MNMSAYQAASKSYAALDLETSINSASPHKLILMLYEGAISSLHKARIFMQEKQTAQKGQEISRAISIIDEGLASCLNEEQGGDIAKNLASLYEYMSFRLMQANIHNNVEWLDEIIKLLTDLRGAWEQIGALATTPPSTGQGLELEAMSPAGINTNQGAETPASVSYGKA